ncbi:putative G-patch domain protein [Aspergillus homomorphus CBS 101889]|uniref:Rna-binding protein n=1 Tax=Aspergillus homomorphus (strain CBS 101889) TaxID=1450537 RepID=A0A395HWM8_ASPHC|nr:hypothetical protein BO97DRAFT_390469 [Aspergillus homomorphus CBS 101889]RAL12210.1 hypothetical protein BO97DRAFT_390469 [Aspergillus homomorphus CBS 101889]
MSQFHPEDNRYPPGPPHRPVPRRDDRDGRMYDDRSPSRSRSPGDLPHSPPRGPAAERRGDYARDRPSSRPRYRSRDRDDFRRRSSRTPPPRRGRPAYRDRDREGYRSPGYASRSRSYSRSRSRSPRRSRHSHYGQESREVMMDGLPVDMVEEDVSNELKEFYNVEGLDDVRVIRDRQTKVSRQLGFLRFRDLNQSRAFVERNFPHIYLQGPSAHDDRGTKVRIAYSREREDRARARAEADWTCMMCSIVNYSTRQKCFRCQAPRPDAGPAGPPGLPAPKVENHGDNDAAPENQPSQFLLFRGLESSVTEELLAKGVAKLYRPSSSGNDATGNQKKGAKVASTTGDSNLGARDGSIRRVLLVRGRKSNESWRYGFAEFATIQDAQAAITRLNSFDKFTISSRPVLVSYIHAGVFVPVLNPTASNERFTFSPLNNPSLKLMYWDEEAYVKELTVSTAELDSAKGDKAAGQDGQTKGNRDADKAKKRKADAAASAGAKKMAVPSHLQFWSNRHAELHGIQKKDAEERSGGEQPPEPAASPMDPAAPPSQSYANPNQNCCYLCMRKFKSTAQVNLHERLSQMHRDNLENEERIAHATRKLVKHGIIPQPTEYRDRARERRQAFGRSKAGAKPRPAAPPSKEEEPAVQTTSKGASLLSKMGWSAGSGLGAQGTGMTAPIATEVYAQGVGLGAQGGKLGDASEEASRNTRGRYDEFLEKTRQTARERYEQMDQ